MTARPFETPRSDQASGRPRAWRHQIELLKMLAAASAVYATVHVLIQWAIG